MSRAKKKQKNLYSKALFIRVHSNPVTMNHLGICQNFVISGIRSVQEGLVASKFAISGNSACPGSL